VSASIPDGTIGGARGVGVLLIALSHPPELRSGIITNSAKSGKPQVRFTSPKHVPAVDMLGGLTYGADALTLAFPPGICDVVVSLMQKSFPGVPRVALPAGIDCRRANDRSSGSAADNVDGTGDVPMDDSSRDSHSATVPSLASGGGGDPARGGSNNNSSGSGSGGGSSSSSSSGSGRYMVDPVMKDELERLRYAGRLPQDWLTAEDVVRLVEETAETALIADFVPPIPSGSVPGGFQAPPMRDRDLGSVMSDSAPSEVSEDAAGKRKRGAPRDVRISTSHPEEFVYEPEESFNNFPQMY
jgi:hypothetical protein